MGTPSDWSTGFKSMILATAVMIVLLMYVTMCMGILRIPFYFVK